MVFVVIALGNAQSAEDEREKHQGGTLDETQGGNLCLPSLLTTGVKDQETRGDGDWRNSERN